MQLLLNEACSLHVPRDRSRLTMRKSRPINQEPHNGAKNDQLRITALIVRDGQRYLNNLQYHKTFHDTAAISKLCEVEHDAWDSPVPFPGRSTVVSKTPIERTVDFFRVKRRRQNFRSIDITYLKLRKQCGDPG